MTTLLRKRFNDLGVPAPDELPEDLERVVRRGLEQGRVLCITRVKNEEGVTQHEWSFLVERQNDYE